MFKGSTNSRIIGRKKGGVEDLKKLRRGVKRNGVILTFLLFS